MIKTRIQSFVILLMLVYSCSGNQSENAKPEQPKSEQSKPNPYSYKTNSVDFSGKDMRLIVDYIVWAIQKARFVNQVEYKAKKPKWIIAAMINDTDEHIDVTLLMGLVRNRLFNKSLANFMGLRKKNGFYSYEEAMKIGLTQGGKYLITGRIKNSRKVEKRKIVEKREIVKKGRRRVRLRETQKELLLMTVVFNVRCEEIKSEKAKKNYFYFINHNNRIINSSFYHSPYTYRKI